MIEEILDIFLGGYYNYIPDDYPLRDYFTSIICVGTELILLAGALILSIVVAGATIKVLRGLR